MNSQLIQLQFDSLKSIFSWTIQNDLFYKKMKMISHMTVVIYSLIKPKNPQLVDRPQIYNVTVIYKKQNHLNVTFIHILYRFFFFSQFENGFSFSTPLTLSIYATKICRNTGRNRYSVKYYMYDIYE